MRDYFNKHYREWVYQPIPALGNLSPKQALSDPQGREKLKELLKDFANSDVEQDLSHL